jgi:hypothetical protein
VNSLLETIRKDPLSVDANTLSQVVSSAQGVDAVGLIS